MSLIAKVQLAKIALAQAEANLEKAIREIESAPRSEKVTISGPLEDAFDALRSVKAEVAELEALIARSEAQSTLERPREE